MEKFKEWYAKLPAWVTPFLVGLGAGYFWAVQSGADKVVIQ